MGFRMNCLCVGLGCSARWNCDDVRVNRTRDGITRGLFLGHCLPGFVAGGCD